MTGKLVIRGVPRALVRDAWWFGADTSEAGNLTPGKEAGTGHGPERPLFILVALIALADILFWGHLRGLSLPVFAMAVFAAVAVGRPWREVWRPLALLGFAALPAVEYVQLLSFLFLAAGLVAAVASVRLPGTRHLGDVAGRAVGLVLRMPLQGLRDLESFFKQPRSRDLADGTAISGF